MTLKNAIVTACMATGLALLLYTFAYIYKAEGLELSVPAFYNGIATLLVGFVAFIVYTRQKVDSKKDSARIILLEIQNAEKVLKLAQLSLESSRENLPADVVTIPRDSWEQNKYLFVTDFDTSEWEAITSFYNTCSLFDTAVKTNASFFHKNEEQIRVHILKTAAKLTTKYVRLINASNSVEEKSTLRKDLPEKIEEWTVEYLAAAREYKPLKPITDAKSAIEKIKLNISLASAIAKLKELVD